MKDKTQLEAIVDIVNQFDDKGHFVHEYYEVAQQILDLCQPQWIDVNEQSMPDMFIKVLVYQSTGAVFIAQFEGVDGWYSANNLPIEEPIGWKPLPEPPGESE